MTAAEKRQEMGKAIIEFEGRFDKNGNLLVYKLPTGDGGGAYEIAGINEKFHSKINPGISDRYGSNPVAYFKELIEKGNHGKAKIEAAAYIEEYTRPVRKFFLTEQLADDNPAIEFVLRDAAWNRGMGGAAAILQIALGVTVDGVAGSKTKEAFARNLAEYGSANLLRRLTAARETYERNTYPWKRSKRDESSKFWAGLNNRWNKAHNVALNRFT